MAYSASTTPARRAPTRWGANDNRRQPRQVEPTSLVSRLPAQDRMVIYRAVAQMLTTGHPMRHVGFDLAFEPTTRGLV